MLISSPALSRKHQIKIRVTAHSRTVDPQYELASCYGIENSENLWTPHKKNNGIYN